MATSAQTTSKNSRARDEILATIRASLKASLPFDAAHRRNHSEEESVSTVSSSARTSTELLDGFRKNLESVGGICHLVASDAESAEIIAETIRSLDAKRIAITDSELVRRVVRSDESTELLENPSPARLFDCDLGVTSAQWAIAETGTLVLESERESHRLTSLVPAKHLCILKASTIRQTLGEILELTKQDLSRTITFITGASRTSDIELTLAIGVHGPKELHVIVIANE